MRSTLRSTAPAYPTEYGPTNSARASRTLAVGAERLGRCFACGMDGYTGRDAGTGRRARRYFRIALPRDNLTGADDVGSDICHLGRYVKATDTNLLRFTRWHSSSTTSKPWALPSRMNPKGLKGGEP